MAQTNEKDLISVEEVAHLLERLLQSAGSEGVTEDEMARMLDWTRQTIIETAMLEMFREGTVRMRFPPDGNYTVWRTDRPGKEARHDDK